MKSRFSAIHGLSNEMYSISRRCLLQAMAWPGVPRKGLSAAKHTNLFNGDSCTYFYNPELWQPEGGPYSAKAIHRYVHLLADSGVDTFVINPNAQVAWYPSKKLQTVLDGYKRGDREFFRGHAIAAGITADKMESYLDHQAKPYDELCQQVGPNVLIYGVVEDAPNWVRGYSPSLEGQPLSLTSAAFSSLGNDTWPPVCRCCGQMPAGKLALGVDGIEQFNFLY